MMPRLMLICLGIGLCPLVIWAQLVANVPETAIHRPVADIINDYVRTGLNTNLSLRSADLEIERSQAALDIARSRFFPEATLGARYTRAEGGRELTLPIFNQSFALQRPREQDTRLTVKQALFAPAIPAAVRAQRSLLQANEFARLALSARLRRDITVGYLDWLRTTRGENIIKASQLLLAENLRISESLFRNGKITQDQVLRAKAELLTVEQQLTEISNMRSQVQSFVNFLLNQDLTTELEFAEIETEVQQTTADLKVLRNTALKTRPEIDQSERIVIVARSRLDIARSARLPILALGIDNGIQGERYEFGGGRNFSTVSLLLNWTVTDGGSRRAEINAARALEKQAQLQREEISQKIKLEVQQALDQLKATAASLRAAQARLEATRAAFRISERKRDEGMLSQVEFLDSRVSLTNAELNLNAIRTELLARQAELDYATGASLP
ncbi:MAG: TolC family protein [Gammaproteobacteria bacterium]|nr:TolC family protein [Gammaproteobacteria bacterium]